jgi:hypothetical protein
MGKGSLCAALFFCRVRACVGSGRVGSGRVGAYGGRYGRGAGNRSLGAGNGSLDGFFARPVQYRQNGQDRAHVPEKCLGFDCCPDATPGEKVMAVREK